jgi:uncharacterized membrane protein (DUF485 family)
MPLSEQQSDAHHLIQDPEFQDIVRRKNSISTILAVIMLAAYFGFMGLLAFAPDVLSAPSGRATIGIPIGIGIIIFAWILTGVYVRWANSTYDDMITHLKSRVAKNRIAAAGETVVVETVVEEIIIEDSSR